MSTRTVGTKPYLVGFGAGFPGKFEDVRPPSDAIQSILKRFLPTLYMLDLYISMIYLIYFYQLF